MLLCVTGRPEAELWPALLSGPEWGAQNRPPCPQLLGVPCSWAGCAPALCDITAALCDITARQGLQLAEPQWAQSFWDRGAERTCRFQGSPSLRWRGERLRPQGAPGHLSAPQGAGLSARASRSPLGTHQRRGRGTRWGEPAGGIGPGASVHTALGGPGSGAAGGSLWFDPHCSRDGAGGQPKARPLGGPLRRLLPPASALTRWDRCSTRFFPPAEASVSRRKGAGLYQHQVLPPLANSVQCGVKQPKELQDAWLLLLHCTR